MLCHLRSRSKEDVISRSIALHPSSEQKPPKESKTKLTIIVVGKPGSKGIVLSKYSMCSLDNEMSSTFKFVLRCSTFHPPMIGKTYGVLCITYTIATTHTPIRNLHTIIEEDGSDSSAVILDLTSTPATTFSNALHTFTSTSVRYQFRPHTICPFSPVSF